MFIRVFRCPMSYPEEFCFNGGIPVQFTMVDWFNCDAMDNSLMDFIRDKVYYNPLYNYIAISDTGEVISINGRKR